MIIDGRLITRPLTRAEKRFARTHGDLPAIRTVRAKARAHSFERTLKLAYAAIATAAFVFTVYKAQPLTVELAAYTWSGARFVAGSGDTCTAAFEHSRIPDDWRELTCESFDVFGRRVR